MPNFNNRRHNGSNPKENPQNMQNQGQPMPNQGQMPYQGQPMPNQGQMPYHGQPMPNQGQMPYQDQQMPNPGQMPFQGQPMPNQPAPKKQVSFGEKLGRMLRPNKYRADDLEKRFNDLAAECGRLKQDLDVEHDRSEYLKKTLDRVYETIAQTQLSDDGDISFDIIRKRLSERLNNERNNATNDTFAKITGSIRPYCPINQDDVADENTIARVMSKLNNRVRDLESRSFERVIKDARFSDLPIYESLEQALEQLQQLLAFKKKADSTPERSLDYFLSGSQSVTDKEKLVSYAKKYAVEQLIKAGYKGSVDKYNLATVLQDLVNAKLSAASGSQLSALQSELANTQIDLAKAHNTIKSLEKDVDSLQAVITEYEEKENQAPDYSNGDVESAVKALLAKAGVPDGDLAEMFRKVKSAMANYNALELLLAKTGQENLEAAIEFIFNKQDEKVAKLKSKHEAEIDAIRSQHDDTVAQIRADHKSKIDIINEAHADEIKEINASNAETLSNLKEQHRGNVLEIKSQHAEEVKKLNDKYDDAISLHREEVERINEAHAAKLDEVNAANDAKIKAVKDQFNAEIDEINKLHDEVIEAKDAEISRQAQSFEATIKAKDEDIALKKDAIDNYFDAYSQLLEVVLNQIDEIKSAYKGRKPNGTIATAINETIAENDTYGLNEFMESLRDNLEEHAEKPAELKQVVHDAFMEILTPNNATWINILGRFYLYSRVPFIAETLTQLGLDINMVNRAFEGVEQMLKYAGITLAYPRLFAEDYDSEVYEMQPIRSIDSYIGEIGKHVEDSNTIVDLYLLGYDDGKEKRKPSVSVFN